MSADQSVNQSTKREAKRPRAAYSYFHEMTTRWDDNDVYGHVNNVRFYAFFDTAVNSYLIAKGVLDPLRSQSIGLVVRTECDYFAPLSFPASLEIGVGAEHIGASSVHYILGVFAIGADAPAAQGRFVHVYVDAQTRQPKALPQELRMAVESLKQGA